jgi:hypothetical protein
VGEDEQIGLTVFTFDRGGAIATIDDFWPEPSEPLPGREHLVERFSSRLRSGRVLIGRAPRERVGGRF